MPSNREMSRRGWRVLDGEQEAERRAHPATSRRLSSEEAADRFAGLRYTLDVHRQRVIAMEADDAQAVTE